MTEPAPKPQATKPPDTSNAAFGALCDPGNPLEYMTMASEPGEDGSGKNNLLSILVPADGTSLQMGAGEPSGFRVGTDKHIHLYTGTPPTTISLGEAKGPIGPMEKGASGGVNITTAEDFSFEIGGEWKGHVKGNQDVHITGNRETKIDGYSEEHVTKHKWFEYEGYKRETVGTHTLEVHYGDKHEHNLDVTTALYVGGKYEFIWAHQVERMWGKKTTHVYGTEIENIKGKKTVNVTGEEKHYVHGKLERKADLETVEAVKQKILAKVQEVESNQQTINVKHKHSLKAMNAHLESQIRKVKTSQNKLEARQNEADFEIDMIHAKLAKWESSLFQIG